MAKTKAKRAKKTKSPKVVKAAKLAKARRLPKRLSHIFYCYVEPINGRHAREYGKKHFGSFSAYVDALVASDRKEKFLSVPISVSKLKTETAKKAKKATKKAPKKAEKKVAPKAKKPTKKAVKRGKDHPIPAPITETTMTETTASAEQQAA